MGKKAIIFVGDPHNSHPWENVELNKAHSFRSALLDWDYDDPIFLVPGQSNTRDDLLKALDNIDQNSTYLTIYISDHCPIDTVPPNKYRLCPNKNNAALDIPPDTNIDPGNGINETLLTRLNNLSSQGAIVTVIFSGKGAGRMFAVTMDNTRRTTIASNPGNYLLENHVPDIDVFDLASVMHFILPKDDFETAFWAVYNDIHVDQIPMIDVKT